MTVHVKVTFVPGNPSQQKPDYWDFDNPNAKVRAADEIHLTRDSSNGANWTFVTANVVDGGTEFRVDPPSDSGKKLVIHDRCTRDGAYCYTVTVTDATGARHTSPDPQIVNSPGGIMSGAQSSVYVAVGLVVGAIAGALIDANTGPLESRGMLKGLIVGAILGAIVGVLLGRMLAGRRAP